MVMKRNCILVILFAAGCGVRQAPTPPAADADEPGNKLFSTPNDVHALILDETAAVFAEGTNSGTVVVDDPPGVTLQIDAPVGGQAQPPHQGVHTSRVIAAEFPFNDVVPSWNVDCPRHAGFVVELRLGRGERGFWTPYYYLGRWGAAAAPTEKIQHDPNGDVDIDYFRSTHRFDRVQYRVRLFSSRRGPLPVLRRFGLACSNTLNDADLARRFRKPIDPGPQEKWARRLPVPFRSQKWEAREVRGSICSPTSVSMVLEYYGVRLPTSRVYEVVYDEEFKLYGNWARAVQTACHFGVPGYIERFGDWNAVKRHIAAGRPVIASIRIEKGQLRNAPHRESSGHLLVITGFDGKGGVHINDPAGATREEGVVTHPLEDVEKIWFEHGGVGYVLLGQPLGNGAAAGPAGRSLWHGSAQPPCRPPTPAIWHPGRSGKPEVACAASSFLIKTYDRSIR